MSRDNRFTDALHKQTTDLNRRISKFETWEPNQIVYSAYNVSNPPTAAELILAFGAAASFVNKIGILNDNGGGANVYLVFAYGGSYFYSLFTLAV